jgi:catechol-2,3-dioxygenase
VSEALYLYDPDGNSVELYWEIVRRSNGRAPDGGLVMFTRALDLDARLKDQPR